MEISERCCIQFFFVVKLESGKSRLWSLPNTVQRDVCLFVFRFQKNPDPLPAAPVFVFKNSSRGVAEFLLPSMRFALLLFLGGLCICFGVEASYSASPPRPSSEEAVVLGHVNLYTDFAAELLGTRVHENINDIRNALQSTAFLKDLMSNRVVSFVTAAQVVSTDSRVLEIEFAILIDDLISPKALDEVVQHIISKGDDVLLQELKKSEVLGITKVSIDSDLLSVSHPNLRSTAASYVDDNIDTAGIAVASVLGVVFTAALYILSALVYKRLKESRGKEYIAQVDEGGIGQYLPKGEGRVHRSSINRPDIDSRVFSSARLPENAKKNRYTDILP